MSIAGRIVTANQLETASGSLGTFFVAFYAAVKTKNFETGVEVTLEEAVTLAADLGLGEPFTSIAERILPLVFGEFNQIAAEPLIAVDGERGGLVTQAWIDDPRHKLDAEGNFQN
jgi:hypothetical protein